MRLNKLRLKAFRGMSDKFELAVGGSNLLVYGENGSSKSSIARALELLLDPDPNCDLLRHQNLFCPSSTIISAEFTDEIVHTRPADGRQFRKRTLVPLTWTLGQAKTLPSWVQQSAYRSAFLDHRKLMILSDHQRDPAESFFLAAVEHLFGRLPVGATNETVSMVWARIKREVATFRKTKRDPGRPSATGVSAAVAHHVAIESDVNALNNTLQFYLQPHGKRPTPLVQEAQRLLRRFEHLQISIDIEYESLGFNRKNGILNGGLIRPHIVFCKKGLGADQHGAWTTTHHLVLNEARLTALALALFFAAVRLQDRIAYKRANDEPTEPARLLVLDDVLVGLDYEHRFPVLRILQEEFLKANRFQLILLTHNREWFDLCRLKVGSRGWKHIEMFTRRETGPAKPDYPVIKKGATDLLKRAKEFIEEDHDIPAAANYARTALEWALKELCASARIPIPFSLEPHRHDTEEFLVALAGRGRKGRRKKNLIPKAVRSELEAIRKTVLNPYSHWHPTTAVESDVRRAVSVAEHLVKTVKSGRRLKEHGTS